MTKHALKIWELILLAMILLGFFMLSLNSLKQNSVTIDEFAHLPAGISYLRTRDFRMYPHSPPLLRMISALPVLKGDVKLPLKQGWETGLHFLMGFEFMKENEKAYQEIFIRARLMTVLLGMILVTLVWWWSRSLYGPASGIFSATLTAFCPNIMAHSGLVTTDTGTSLLFLATIFSFWRFCRNPSALRCILSGLILGLALLSKFTSLILIPLMIILGFFYYFFNRNRISLRYLCIALLSIFLLSVIVLNTGYLWKGTGKSLEHYQFKSHLVSNLANKLPAKMPIPLPYDYVRGFDLQSEENESQYVVYLLGQISVAGWRYYYLIAMAVKMTVASLALILAGLVSFGWQRKLWLDEMFLLLPPLSIIAGISLFTDINLGLRYILPAIPFLYIFASRLVSSIFNFKWMAKALFWILLLSHLVSNLLIYPDYLAYFNFLAGGPKNGYKILADSNLDWGQGLLRLKKYMDENKIERICLAYFGRVDPGIYGINYELPYREANCNLLAVSASFLAGIPYALLDHGEIIRIKSRQFEWLKEEKPVAVIGYSIFIYDLSRNNLLRDGIYGLEHP